MLDHWSASTMHTVGVVYMELLSQARRYRTVCSCGWRSIEGNTPELFDCPVKAALDERARRQKRTEHVSWLPLDKPVSSK